MLPTLDFNHGIVSGVNALSLKNKNKYYYIPMTSLDHIKNYLVLSLKYLERYKLLVEKYYVKGVQMTRDNFGSMLKIISLLCLLIDIYTYLHVIYHRTKPIMTSFPFAVS
jgi:hypothetical protein